ncbi:MAG: MCP four helix bundle domain-containing protein [Bacteroidetes bacterium]|nr:MCP four helix bundle domain-containing protein [Bacteroidota bacterium]MBU1114408.1 MCP four helix bundle domain-containing protein [Bacteroidota bacterium]MBU1797209.1 MCP four helix bundle domain-containing protein [Bacteroidota bacterium]
MKYFTNLSTRAKLLFSFGFIWVMLLVIIVIAYQSLQNITQSEKYLFDVHSKIALELRQLRSHQNFNRAAILDMMLTKDKTEQAAIENIITDKGKDIADIIEKLAKLKTEQQFQNRLTELKSEIEAYRQTRSEEISLIQKGKLEEAQKVATNIQKNRFEKIRAISTEMGDNAEKDAEAQLTLDLQSANTAILIFVVFGIAALFFSIIIVIIMNRTIAQPLTEITKIAARIGKGDLNVEFSMVERQDEVGILLLTFSRMVDILKQMATAAQQIAAGNLTISVVPQSEKDLLGNAFSQMLNNLRRMTKDILEGVNLLGSSASEILAATTQVASGSAETATAITETTTTVEEVRQAAQLSNQKASRVSENAQQVSQVTQTGQKAVEETVSGMHEIQNQMEAVANTIIRLSEQSQQIGGIIASVTDVADQSNLLAVNASIEAAKAGEQGKGFAVVAQEIKSLAEQSKQATIQVRNILTDVQKATSAAVMATEQTSKAVENGVKQSTQAGKAIMELAESSGKAMEAASQIVASSQQQVVGMDQIGLAMKNINQAGTENAASMLQAEKAAKGLNELGHKLKELVEQYKI